jgi:hypothetical protein
MKLNPVLAASMGAIGLMGCADTEPPATSSATPTHVSARELRSEARATVDAVGKSAAGNREQFLSCMEAKLKESGQRIADFDAKLVALSSESAAKAEGNKALDVLRGKRTQLGQQLEKLRQCSQETWLEARTTVELAAAEVDNAYEIAKSRLRN